MVWKDLVRAAAFVSFASLYVTGMVTIVLVASFGPLVAQGLQAVLAVNPEPKLVHDAFPWLPSLLAAALPWPLLFSGRVKVATLATVPMILAPVWHLVDLYQRSA